jgi:hypothetical protein
VIFLAAVFPGIFGYQFKIPEGAGVACYLSALTLFPYIIIFIIARFLGLRIQICQLVCFGCIPYTFLNRLGRIVDAKSIWVY